MREEQRLTALENQTEAWAEGLSAGVDPEIMAEVALATAFTELLRSSGEDAAIIDIEADAAGQCTCGLHNARLGLALALRFDKAQLPWLTNWQHWAKGEFVTGLEPGTNPPIGQARARQENQLLVLAPGESRHYELEIEVLHSPAAIQDFLTHTLQINQKVNV